MFSNIKILILLLGTILTKSVYGNTPVVLWHGMGDSCCNPISMGSIKNLIETNVTGIYVKSIEIGKNAEEDIFNSFFKNTNDQISLVCKIIKNDTKLANGYHAIGFSQGGQFLRAVAQRCPDPPIRNLISIGGQHQGVYGFPRCPDNLDKFCNEVRQLLNLGAYGKYVQSILVQAQYWHDPLNEKEYKEKSLFLADINQENGFNKSYRENILKLKNLVLVKFNRDEMVIPKESEWFGFYKPGQTSELYRLEESVLYLNDTLGLQTLDREGRLYRLSVDGDHLKFSREWFIENIVDTFLRDKN